MIKNEKAEKWATEFCEKWNIDRAYVTDETLENEHNFLKSNGVINDD